MTTDRIRLGISTCPNDTFAFHALMHRAIPMRGIQFEVELLDIEQLNLRLIAETFDLAKASFHLALKLADRYWVLPSGSALGFGVGPLLLSAMPGDRPAQASDSIVLCPGENTTAALLYELFYPQCGRVEHTVFSEIMPALVQRRTDFGVCIHEGRFTWQTQGLSLVEDLGTRWESATGLPLPLGGILASRRLTSGLIQRANAVIRDSIQYGIEHPDEALCTMRKHAQEFDDRVLMQHVQLYVNSWTLELGAEGERSLGEMHRRASDIGLAQSRHPIEVFG